MICGRILHGHVGLHRRGGHVRRAGERRVEGSESRAPGRLRRVRVGSSHAGLERRRHATVLARRSKLVVGRESHLVVELGGMGVERAPVRSVVLRAKVATAAVALHGMARLAAEVCSLRSQGRVGGHGALSHMALEALSG